jgi:hypothetical protein
MAAPTDEDLSLMEAMGMSDGDLSDQIARIEADIEQLAQTLEGCRKAMALSRVAIAAGGIWIVAYFLGVIRFDPALMVGAIAAIIGGIVILGSNSSTSTQTMAEMKVAETQRAKLIDMINPRAVGASLGTDLANAAKKKSSSGPSTGPSANRSTAPPAH